MSGGSMGGMAMGNGAPSLFRMQQMYWAVVGAAIGTATFVNVLNKIIAWQRTTSRHSNTPAKPKSIFSTGFATITAITREVSNANVRLTVFGRYRCVSPTVGRLSLVLAELILVLVLCFYKLDPSDQWQWEDVGYRTGFIAAAQLPLVILLAGKRNIVALLIGSSYERLNWLHRWVARILFLTVTIHMGFWFTDWERYDYIKVKLKTDKITQRGFSAWCILLWIVLSSFAPLRRWNYEFFVAQHIITFVGFLAAVFLHLPAEVKAYIWIPIALYALDRFVRTVWVLFINMSIFHPISRNAGFLSCEATLEPLSCGASRLVIASPPISWRPGQHVFLSCHGIAPLQSHPFTIASIPEDNRMEFIVKSKKGATKRFHTRAQKSQYLPLKSDDVSAGQGFTAILDGPYGRMRPLQQFDSIFLIAGSSGGSFTVPLMRSIVARWKQDSSLENRRSRFRMSKGAVTRYIRFVWVIKSLDQYQWFGSQFAPLFKDVEQLCSTGMSVRIDMSIYVTCDPTLEPNFEASVPLKSFPASHSRAEEVSPNVVAETEKAKMEIVSVHSAQSDSTIEPKTVKKSCGPDGTCCCATTIEDEDAITKAEKKQQYCCCGSTSSATARAKPSNLSSEAVRPESDVSETSSTDADISKALMTPRRVQKASPIDIPHQMSILTGRPQPKTLIRKTLEQALGESAVVVCGPQGLNDDVRSSVVALSDERAVHKGTGAQGIYFWEEGFGYA